MTRCSNAERIGKFLAEAPTRDIPPEVFHAAKRCLLDWTGVALAGSGEPVSEIAAKFTRIDPRSVPVFSQEIDTGDAAFMNGVAAHALDFDDTHIPTDSHLSAVIWAALLVTADPKRHSGDMLLRAFVAGYEAAAKLSGRRFGFSLQFRWFHPTSVIGRLASSAAVAVLMRLDQEHAAQAVALSTTRAAGLGGTLGGMGKPLQVGEAARDGIVCARLAKAGAIIDPGVLSPDGGFIRAYVQDGTAALASLDGDTLGSDWAVLKTSFKPYACLHGIHPSIDAAMDLAGRIDVREATAVHTYVAPGVKKIAAFDNPTTPLEAKFSIPFCVAAALCGRQMSAADFSHEAINEEDIRRLRQQVMVIAEDGRKMLDSAIEITLTDGVVRRGESKLSKGHPGNPMSWQELVEKFEMLAFPRLGAETTMLPQIVEEFDTDDGFLRWRAVLAP